MQPKGTVSARMMPLARALAEKGHRVRVVVPPWDDPSAKPGLAVGFVGPQPGGGWLEVNTLAIPQPGPRSLRLTSAMLR
ncbi:MAG: hypothetical protein M3328_05830, partial [Chloroflexota bacterium]|nr:hypothetical protein [Chloroflexota bacterium]